MDNMILKRYEQDGFNTEWRMKDGTIIKIKDMEDSHVRNSLNMLKRNSPNEIREAWIEVFTDVILKRRKLKLDKIKDKLNSEK